MACSKAKCLNALDLALKRPMATESLDAARRHSGLSSSQLDLFRPLQTNRSPPALSAPAVLLRSRPRVGNKGFVLFPQRGWFC